MYSNNTEMIFIDATHKHSKYEKKTKQKHERQHATTVT